MESKEEILAKNIERIIWKNHDIVFSGGNESSEYFDKEGMAKDILSLITEAIQAERKRILEELKPKCRFSKDGTNSEKDLYLEWLEVKAIVGGK